MNHDAAREIADGPLAGRWHYTTANRRSGTHPIGYCRDGCQGHETAEEAREHYRSYLLAERVVLEAGAFVDAQYRCEVDGCEGWATHSTRVGEWTMFTLCDEHRTLDTVAGLVEVGESWHS